MPLGAAWGKEGVWPPSTPGGYYTVNLSPGNYTVCGALQESWTQTAPLLAPPPPEATLADCTAYTDGGTIPLGPRGYNFTMTSAEAHSNLDFAISTSEQRSRPSSPHSTTCKG
jgi:hypothetical protein